MAALAELAAAESGIERLLSALATSTTAIASSGSSTSDACSRAAEEATRCASSVRSALLRMNEELCGAEPTSAPSSECVVVSGRSARPTLLRAVLDALSAVSPQRFSYSANVSRSTGSGGVRLQALTCRWDGVLAAVLHFDAVAAAAAAAAPPERSVADPQAAL